MTVIHPQLRRYLRRLLTIQAILVALAAGSTHFLYGAAESGALIYGGATAVIGTLVLMWYGWRAERVGSGSAQNAKLIYRSAVTRFVTVLALLTAGIAGFKLAPLPLFAGFILGLLGQFITTALVSGNTTTWRAKR